MAETAVGIWSWGGCDVGWWKRGSNHSPHFFMWNNVKNVLNEHKLKPLNNEDIVESHTVIIFNDKRITLYQPSAVRHVITTEQLRHVKISLATTLKRPNDDESQQPADTVLWVSLRKSSTGECQKIKIIFKENALRGRALKSCKNYICLRHAVGAELTHKSEIKGKVCIKWIAFTNRSNREWSKLPFSLSTPPFKRNV